MPRDFNGSSDELVCSIGNAAITFGTIIAIVRTDTDGATRTIVNCRDTSTSQNRAGLYRESTNFLTARFAGSVTSAAVNLVAADGWCLVGVTKGTGTVAPTFHKYVFATNTWTHTAAGVTTGNATVGPNAVHIGHRASDQRWDGLIHLIALRQATLTDQEVERFAYSLMGAWRGQPQALWLFNQGSTGQKVIDLTGGGANESTLTGTTVSTESVPTWTYGAPVLGETRGGTAAVDATVTLTDGAGLARAAGRVDTPTPQISVTAGALATGVAPVPVPTISVTAQALAVGRAPLAYRTYPKIEGLTDNYNDSSLDAAKWTSYANSGATSAETTSQIVVTVDNSAASVYGGINAVEKWSLLESSVYFNVSTYPTQSANTQIYLLVRYDTTHRILLDSINGVWRGRYRDGAGSDTTHASYTGTDPWLKISMASGVVHWWHSADGTSWTEIGTGVTISEAWSGYLTLVDLSFGHFATDIASNTARFDNFNTLGVVSATVTVPSPATARGRVDLPTPQISVTGQALAVGRAELPVPQITVTAGALALADAPVPVAGTITTVSAVPATAIGVVGTGYGSDWGGGWGSLGSVEVVITEVEGAVAVPAVAAGSAPVPALTIAVDGTVARAAGLVGTVVPTITVTALVATALGDAPAPARALDATVTVPLPAVGLGDSPLPIPTISVTGQALALGIAPVPVPTLSVTATVALAVGDVALPVPTISVTGQALAVGRVTVPNLGLVQSATVTVTAAALALGDVSPPVVRITCELDGTPLALTTETLSVLTLTSETLTGVTLTTETLNGIALTATSLFPGTTTYPSSTTYPLDDTPVLETLTLEPA